MEEKFKNTALCKVGITDDVQSLQGEHLSLHDMV